MSGSKNKNDAQNARLADDWLQRRNCQTRSLPVALIRNTNWEILNAGLRLLVGSTGWYKLSRRIRATQTSCHLEIQEPM